MTLSSKKKAERKQKNNKVKIIIKECEILQNQKKKDKTNNLHN